MKTWLPGIIIISTAWVVVYGQTRDGREDPNSGANLYRSYCASCHGVAGRGDGPAAKTLQARPPDLTGIAARRGGTFPTADITQIVDGRRPLAGHTRADMPVWGAILGRMELQDERLLETRIRALVDHLRSLQKID